MTLGMPRMLPTPCPHCGAELSSFESADSADRAPKDGDLIFCGACRALLIFNADLSVRACTEDETIELGAAPHVQLAATVLAVMREVKKLAPADFDAVTALAGRLGGTVTNQQMAAALGWPEAKVLAVAYAMQKAGLALTRPLR